MQVPKISWLYSIVFVDILCMCIQLNAIFWQDHPYVCCFILQAIGDSGQGFLNFLFFCVLQRRVRQYTLDVIRQCLRYSKYYCKHHTDKTSTNNIIDDSYTESCTPSQMSNYSSDPPRDWVEEWKALLFFHSPTIITLFFTPDILYLTKSAYLFTCYNF